jgi:GAF domain-containing protein
VWNGAGELIGVFDIDSDQPAAFAQGDATALAKILEEVFGRC